VPESAVHPLIALVAARGGQDEERSALAASAAALVERGRGAWPELDPPAATVLTSIDATTDGGRPLAEQLDALDAGEVWLAAACAEGDGRALRAFDRAYVAPLDAALSAMELARDQIDDIKQRVRERLLGPGDGSIRLLEYCGRGRLEGLTKTVAIRIALDDIRHRRRKADQGSADARTIDCLLDADLGPELTAAASQHRQLVKDAFATAVSALEPRERAVLRMHLLDRASIDDIAALHDVHRATVARQLVRIREKIASRTREQLRAGLRTADVGLDSLLRAVDSRLDLSLSRVLAASRADDVTEEPT
jgi:RNA polymerase sigma-70 factor (ECF subfamily)